DHAVVFVHDNHAARTHDGAQLRQAFVVDWRVEHLAGDATAGRSSGLHRLNAAAVEPASADVVNERLDGWAHPHFDHAAVVDFAHERKGLGSRALGAAGLGKPCRTLGDDGRDVVPGLDVINVAGLAPQALLRRKWRPRAGTTRFTFERCDQRRLFTTDKRS